MSISAVYYRKADGVVFVFDVTKPRSFTNVETIWMNAVDAPERYTRICTLGILEITRMCTLHTGDY